MAEVFRHADEEHTLRSSGDTPGLVGAGLVQVDNAPWWGFTISQRVEDTPSTTEIVALGIMEAMGGRGAVSKVITDDEESSTMIPVELEDAVAACVDKVALTDLIMIATSLVQNVASYYAPQYAFEAVVDCAAWAVRVREQVGARLEEMGELEP
jgi:hypothetical protein